MYLSRFDLGVFYGNLVTVKVFFFKLFFKFFQYFSLNARPGFGSINFFRFVSRSSNEFFFQDVKFLYGFFSSEFLLRSYKLIVFKSAVFSKLRSYKSKMAGVAFSKGTRLPSFSEVVFPRPRSFGWRHRIRGFFRRGRLRFLLSHRFFHRNNLRLVFPGAGSRALYFRERHYLLYFSLVLGTFKKAFSSILSCTALYRNVFNF